MNTFSYHRLACSLSKGMLILLLLGQMSTLLAQISDYLHFQHYSYQDGLSSGKIRCFLQDQEGFIWIGTQQGLNRFDGNTIKRYYFDPQDTLTISSNVLKALAEDDQGRIWIGTKNAGLVYFDKKQETFHRVRKGPLNSDLWINTMIWSSEGVLWIGTDGDAVYGFSPQTDSILTLAVTGNPATGLSGGEIKDIWEGPAGKLWIATSKGLTVYNPLKRQFSYFFHEGTSDDQHRNRMQSIYPDDSSTFWLGTHNGITHWDPLNQRSLRYYPSGDSSPHIHNIINDIWELDDRYLWVASRKGLLLFDKLTKKFDYLSDNYNDLNELRDSPYNCIFEDQAGLIWIGGNDGVYTWNSYGLNFYEAYSSLSRPSKIHRRLAFQGDTMWVATEKGVFFSLPHDTAHFVLSDNFYSVMAGADGHIYAGPWEDSQLYRINPRSLQVDLLPVPKSPNPQQALSTFTDIIQGDTRFIWAISRDRLFRLDTPSQQLREIPVRTGIPIGFSEPNYNDLLIDTHDNLWIGSDKGLFLLRAEERQSKEEENWQFTHFTYDPADSTSLGTNEINTLFEDKRGILWIGSKSGLLRYDPSQKRFFRHQETEALAHGYITCILQDEKGDIWISTDNSGIIRLIPGMSDVQTYQTEDGLLSTSFNWNACTCSPNHGLIFASREGFNHFYADSLSTHAETPAPIYLTELWVQHQRIQVGDATHILSESLLSTSKITLKHFQNVIKFEFALLDFGAPNKNTYRYKLDNFDEQWHTLGNQNEILYSYLTPGRYTFRVQGRTSRGEWTSVGDVLTIRVLPPWWWNGYAWAIYLWLLIIALWALYKNQLSLRLREAEAEKALEIDRVRKQLYTNITHEFRTPLTVIKGMNELLEEQYGEDPFIQDHALLLDHNTSKLLHLINQILDLSKAEAGKLPLNLTCGNVIPLVRYIVDSFYSYARTKNITLSSELEVEEVIMDVDPDKLVTVLSNLLSNALKFTPEQGKITVRARRVEDSLLLSVQDTGIGIDADRIPYIFNRYFQVEQSPAANYGGTGIGLALTQELVQLMKGTIRVTSLIHEGSTFFVDLPITQLAEQVADHELIIGDNLHKSMLDGLLSSGTPVSVQDDSDVKDESLVVLVIDDSDSIRMYLDKLLSPHFQLHFAENGTSGIEKALEKIPDIIISDVMMPEADGMHVCKVLKQDERTCHIPIILLTAKVDQLSKIEGLSLGADAYLAKPLDRVELFTRIKKLVELRNRLREKYQLIPQTSYPTSGNPDEKFLQRIREIIEESIGDHQLGVEDICRRAGVSRTQLHRKLRALVNLSTSQMIRKIRLRHAKEKLIYTDEAIAQIAYEVGFSDPSYFAKTYKEEYRESPSDTRESLKKESK